MSIPVIKRKLATNLKCHRTGHPVRVASVRAPWHERNLFQLTSQTHSFAFFSLPFRPPCLPPLAVQRVKNTAWRDYFRPLCCNCVLHWEQPVARAELTAAIETIQGVNIIRGICLTGWIGKNEYENKLEIYMKISVSGFYLLSYEKFKFELD